MKIKLIKKDVLAPDKHHWYCEIDGLEFNGVYDDSVMEGDAFEWDDIEGAEDIWEDIEEAVEKAVSELGLFTNFTNIQIEPERQLKDTKDYIITYMDSNQEIGKETVATDELTGSLCRLMRDNTITSVVIDEEND